MNNDHVEERLREALRMHAAEAPPGATMLSEVAAESTRRGRRSRLATIASGAAALAVIGVAVPLALRAAPPLAAPVAAPPVTTAPASVPVRGKVVFPFTPPSGDGYGKVLITLTAGHPTADQPVPGGGAVLTALTDRPAPPSSKAVATPATVAGRAATIYSWQYSDNPDDPQRTLVWPASTTTWLSLQITPPQDAATLIAYAERVGPVPVSAPVPFVFPETPPGWTVDNIAPAAMTLCPPGVTPDASFVDKIAIMLDESSGEANAGDAEDVLVGGHKARLSTSPEGQVLRVPVAGGRSLILQVGPKAALPREALLSFAASITVTSYAEVSHG